jgi:hypothetical protein
MGADIWGWVETREPGTNQWDAAFEIHDIVYRHYGMFASLFGLRNGDTTVSETGRFRAIAAGRGAPPGASASFVEDRDGYGGAVGETWALWSELAAVNWDEEGEYYIDDEPPHAVYDEPGVGRRRERRGDYLKGGWADLFSGMASLSEQFGAENVRLAVYFDQG